MSDQIDREAAIKEMMSRWDLDEDCGYIDTLRALPAAVPVVDVEKACAEIRMNIVYWEDKHGQDEDIMPFARAIIAAARGRR